MTSAPKEPETFVFPKKPKTEVSKKAAEIMSERTGFDGHSYKAPFRQIDETLRRPIRVLGGDYGL